MFFDAPSIVLAVARIGYLFGIGVDSLTGMASLYYLRSYALPLLIGVVGATPWPKFCALKLADNSAARSILVIAEPLFLAAVLLLATAYLVDGSFNPFIYFRF
jgi:alginate O-acetyltransferase complex protein AlgI